MLGPTSSVGDHVALSPDPHSLSRTLRSTRHNESADLGVKGLRVQISPARPTYCLVRGIFRKSREFSGLEPFAKRRDNGFGLSASSLL
jgi:hypothetical protein